MNNAMKCWAVHTLSFRRPSSPFYRPVTALAPSVTTHTHFSKHPQASTIATSLLYMSISL